MRSRSPKFLIRSHCFFSVILLWKCITIKVKCEALFFARKKNNTRKNPNSIMDGFFKKVNQKVNLGQQPTPDRLYITILNDGLFEKPIQKLENYHKFVICCSCDTFCLFVLQFYSPVNPLGSCQARSVYLTTLFPGQT